MDYSFSIIIAMIAFVYSVLLTEQHALFCGVYNFLYELFETDERISEGKPMHWLFMILIGCDRCVAGQIALWFFLYRNYELYAGDFFEALLIHLGFVSLTILLTVALKESYYKYKHK